MFVADFLGTLTFPSARSIDARCFIFKIVAMPQRIGEIHYRTKSNPSARFMKKLLLPMLFLLLWACTPSSRKPTTSVTGSDEPDAVKEEQRQAVQGFGPR
jgi:hypothetical protein